MGRLESRELQLGGCRYSNWSSSVELVSRESDRSTEGHVSSNPIVHEEFGFWCIERLLIHRPKVEWLYLKTPILHKFTCSDVHECPPLLKLNPRYQYTYNHTASLYANIKQTHSYKVYCNNTNEKKLNIQFKYTYQTRCANRPNFSNINQERQPFLIVLYG